MFTPEVVQLTGSLKLNGPIDKVFELFSPLGEKLWVPGWDPELLHPPGISWAEGMIFRTREELGDAIWTVMRLDPAAHEVKYHRVEPGRHVARIEIRCAALGRNQTEVSTEYEFVGLSGAGNAGIAAMSQEAYTEKMDRWTRWINMALAKDRP